MVEIWYGILAFTMIVYVTLDGRNFGAGILHLIVVITVETWYVRPELFGSMVRNPIAWLAILVSLVLRHFPGKVKVSEDTQGLY